MCAFLHQCPLFLMYVVLALLFLKHQYQMKAIVKKNVVVTKPGNNVGLSGVGDKAVCLN